MWPTVASQQRRCLKNRNEDEDEEEKVRRTNFLFSTKVTDSRTVSKGISAAVADERRASEKEKLSQNSLNEMRKCVERDGR